MTHREFEELAGFEVEYETYSKVIEPMYMATDLDKTTFVAILNRKTLEKNREPEKRMVRVKIGSCPNGTIVHYDAEYVDVDVYRGKVLVKNPSEARVWACVCYDFTDEQVTVVKG